MLVSFSWTFSMRRRLWMSVELLLASSSLTTGTMYTAVRCSLSGTHAQCTCGAYVQCHVTILFIVVISNLIQLAPSLPPVIHCSTGLWVPNIPQFEGVEHTVVRKIHVANVVRVCIWDTFVCGYYNSIVSLSTPRDMNLCPLILMTLRTRLFWSWGEVSVHVSYTYKCTCMHAARVHEPLWWVGRVPIEQKSFASYHP